MSKKKKKKNRTLAVLLALLLIALAIVVGIVIYKQAEYRSGVDYYDSLRNACAGVRL